MGFNAPSANLPTIPRCVALERRDGIQKDPDRHERWAFVNVMKFSEAKCKILHLDWGNPKHKYREWIKGNPVEKDLGW